MQVTLSIGELMAFAEEYVDVLDDLPECTDPRGDCEKCRIRRLRMAMDTLGLVEYLTEEGGYAS